LCHSQNGILDQFPVYLSSIPKGILFDGQKGADLYLVNKTTKPLMRPLPILSQASTCLLLLFFGSVLQAQVKIYGMTALGSGPGVGVLYSINSDGTNFQVLHSFQNQPDGAQPYGGLTMGNDTRLYGVTSGGGAGNAGTVFSYDTATQAYQKLADFTGANGSAPLGTMTWFNGKFYGLANTGGLNGVGDIYCFDPVTSSLTDVYDMDSSSGILPNGSMYLINSKLYYAAAAGGAYGGGTMMGFDPATKTCTDIYDFGPHSSPSSYFTVVGDLLYGTTSTGGGSGSGNLYSFNPITTAYRDHNDFYIYYFGQYPRGVASYNGIIYGTTQDGGPNYEDGLIYSYNLSTRIRSTIYEFDDEFNYDGKFPPYSNPVITPTGLMLGVTSTGGTGGGGTVYSYDINTGVYTVLHNFDWYTTGGSPMGLYLPGAH
jgi:uncharacterized repeat protein (TIGR03803 family)